MKSSICLSYQKKTHKSPLIELFMLIFNKVMIPLKAILLISLISILTKIICIYINNTITFFHFTASCRNNINNTHIIIYTIINRFINLFKVLFKIIYSIWIINETIFMGRSNQCILPSFQIQLSQIFHRIQSVFYLSIHHNVLLGIMEQHNDSL